MNVAKRLKQRDPRRDRTHGLGRCRAEQVSREDRVRLAEARRPHGGCAGTRRTFPARTAGGRVVGRRPGHGAQAARARHRQARRRPRRGSRGVCVRWSVRWREWLKQLAQGIDDRPVVADYELEVIRQREHVRQRSDANMAEIREEIESMARGAARWLAKRDLYARTVTIKVRYDDFTTITRSQSETATRDEDDDRPSRGHVARQDRGRPAADSFAGRQRAQPERHTGPDSSRPTAPAIRGLSATLTCDLSSGAPNPPRVISRISLTSSQVTRGAGRTMPWARRSPRLNLDVGFRDIQHLNHHFVIRARIVGIDDARRRWRPSVRA